MNIQEIKDEVKKLKENMRSQCKILLNQSIAEFFAKHPTILAVGWVQFTPYFNDGEECIFCVNDSEFYVQYEGQEFPDDYDSMISNYGDEPINKDLKTHFTNIFVAMEDDTMKDMFGNHVLIVAKRDGTFETNEYDHD